MPTAWRLPIVTLIMSSVVLAGCGSSGEEDRQAAAVVATPLAEIVALPPSAESIQMLVGQVGEFVVLPDDPNYVIESSAPSVVDVFDGYTDDSGISVEGAGVVAVSVGVAEIQVYNPDEVGDPFERFRIFVTEGTEPIDDAAGDGADGIRVTGGTLGSRICVENATTQLGDRDYTKVIFTKADSAENGYVRPGRPLCAEGTDRGPFTYDVRGELSFRDIPMMTVWAQNPWAGPPGAGSDFLPGKAPDAASLGFCVGGQRFAVGDSLSGDNGVYRLVVTRLPDTRWKEFTIRIEDSKKPTPDGTYRVCE